MSDKNRERDERANNKCIDYRAVDCYLKLTYHNLQIIGQYFPPLPPITLLISCVDLCVFLLMGEEGTDVFVPKINSSHGPLKCIDLCNLFFFLNGHKLHLQLICYIDL